MPYQLSGGEKQRAAIARSLINSPRLLLADEPTGSLDWKTGESVFAVFKRMIRERGLTAVIATHNSAAGGSDRQEISVAWGKARRRISASVSVSEASN